VGRKQPVQCVGLGADLVAVQGDAGDVVIGPALGATGGDHAAAFRLDEFDAAGIRKALFGRIDHLVNNVGTNPVYGPMVDLDLAAARKILDINLVSTLGWVQLVHKASLREHGGAIVHTASIGGMHQSPNMGMYNATKAALIHVTKQLALELSPRVRVNAICPGVVRTKLAEALWKDNEQFVSQRTALGRIGETPDVAAAVAFLVSDEASWITGDTLVIDGGQVLGNVGEFR